MQPGSCGCDRGPPISRSDSEYRQPRCPTVPQVMSIPRGNGEGMAQARFSRTPARIQGPAITPGHREKVVSRYSSHRATGYIFSNIAILTDITAARQAKHYLLSFISSNIVALSHTVSHRSKAQKTAWLPHHDDLTTLIFDGFDQPNN